MAEDAVPQPSTGQTWVHAQSGVEVVIKGRRGREWVCESPSGPLLLMSFDGWLYRSCDHDVACCSFHKKHVSPHKGCMLR